MAKALQAFAQYQLLHLSLDGWLAFQGAAKWNRFPERQAVWDRMLDGFHASIVATIDAGAAVVVDHVLQEKRWLPLLAPVLASRNVYFIGVMCPQPVAQSRIEKRGIKDTETIPHQLQRIHLHDTYDMTVATEEVSSEKIARELIELAVAKAPTAFTELSRKMKAQQGDAPERFAPGDL